MMVNWRKVFLKKSQLALMGGKLLELRVEYEVNGFGIRWLRNYGDSFFIILRKKDNFQNHLLDCSDTKPSTW